MIRTNDMASASTGMPAARRIKLFDVPFDVLSLEQALDVLVGMAKGDRPTYTVTANVDHVVRFYRNPAVRTLYTQADVVVADGMPLIWASWLLRKPLPERVTGSDMLPALCAKAAEHDLSVFLLGGSPDVEGMVTESGSAAAHHCCTPCRERCDVPCAARRAAQVLQARHPKLRVAGTYCPDFGFEKDAAESARILAAVRAAQPDFLFVGLGSPKQEQWIVDNYIASDAKVSIGVGVSFSFVCDHVTRAPRWIQHAGLEWAHRLVQEPRRLWKRYLMNGIALPMLMARELVHRIDRPVARFGDT